MILLLSPAKTLDFSESSLRQHSTPRMLAESHQLVKVLKKKSANAIKKLMGVSDKIATLNVERYKNFTIPFTLDNAKQAVLAFKGDVYIGLQAETFNEKDLEFAQQHLRILSGLYGVLTPLDLMQPYRLEMGTRLKNGKNKNLYDFWDNKITNLINADLEKAESDIILNLASQEYFGAVKPGQLNGKLIHVHFQENRNGIFKVISFNAKKARGAMAHQIIKKKITTLSRIKRLKVNDYSYNKTLSDDTNLYFTK